MDKRKIIKIISLIFTIIFFIGGVILTASYDFNEEGWYVLNGTHNKLGALSLLCMAICFNVFLRYKK